MKLYNFVIKLITKPLMFLLRIKVTDLRQSKEIPPRTIICANHLSNWDPIIAIITTGLPINFMAKQSLFKVPIVSSVIKRFGAFPVKKSGMDASAVKQSIDIIKNGGCFSCRKYSYGRV